VLRLCSVKLLAEQIFKYAVFLIARRGSPDSLYSLFSILCQLPKLNVAGSIPVSRSKLQQSLIPASIVPHTKTDRETLPAPAHRANSLSFSGQVSS
jgi:hypothetical protein